MSQTKFPCIWTLIQGIHDVSEIFVDIDVEFLQGGAIVELLAMCC